MRIWVLEPLANRPLAYISRVSVPVENTWRFVSQELIEFDFLHHDVTYPALKD